MCDFDVSSISVPHERVKFYVVK